MRKRDKYIKLAAFAICFLICFDGCRSNTPEEKKYIAEIEAKRKEKDLEMKQDPSSPFNRDSTAHYAQLKYYDVDPSWVFKSKLNLYEKTDTVVTYGTKGEERRAVKIGYVQISRNGKDFRINIYKSFSRSGVEYHSIWFTDRTTGKETYGVGRYIDFELNNDPGYIYTIDFNQAYSPYCSYSSIYSCAIPTKDNFLDIEITAGEKKFHD